MRLARLAFAAAVLVASPAAAETDFFLTRGLADVIASEQMCSLTYDQAAIDAFITKNVAADDMLFPATLKGAVRLSEAEQAGMTPSGVAAHCTQIRRVAKSYGFTH